MLLDFLQGDFDLIDFLRSMLLSLPAILLALSLHEAGHAYVAYRCGDPTAKMMGRMTINPLKHIDPVGFVMLMLAGVGWAKPVPVNPRNFKNYRRDDLLVSLAGIAANLLQFLVGCILVFLFLWLGVSRIPADMWLNSKAFMVTMSDGSYWFNVSDVFRYFYQMDTYLITPYMGDIAGFLYEILIDYCVINFSLACFNLLPMPPLDGYHVLNDLVLKKDLFASRKFQQIGQAVVLVLVFTGVFSKGMNYVLNGVFGGAGYVMSQLYGLIG